MILKWCPVLFDFLRAGSINNPRAPVLIYQNTSLLFLLSQCRAAAACRTHFMAIIAWNAKLGEKCKIGWKMGKLSGGRQIGVIWDSWRRGRSWRWRLVGLESRWDIWCWQAGGATTLRENFKYYFADFVRKGGSPPPLRTKFSPKKRLRIRGVPPPPLRTFPRKIFFKKC